MVPRGDEAHCQTSFDRYLREKIGLTGVGWKPFPFGESKPPDFHMYLGNRIFAVEVTSLMTQYEQTDGKTLPEESIWRATERLADQVERKATEKGILSGCYVVTVDGPFDNFFQSMPEIRDELLKFIASTQHVAKTPARPALRKTSSGHGYFLNKYEGRRNWVAAGLMSDGGGWGWSIVQELLLLVERAVASKVTKLRDVPKPWILLLFDRHHFAKTDDYERVRELLPSGWAARSFHSIYFVHRNGSVFPLHAPEGGGWS